MRREEPAEAEGSKYMEHELKFRVWDIPCREYLIREKAILGNSEKRDSYIYIYRSTVDNSSNTLEWMIDDKECFDIEQFSGFSDNNGKDIYAGDWCDVVFADGTHCHAEVSFVDACFELHFVSPVVVNKYYTDRDYLKCYVINHAVEIIGNKHESPPLAISGESR